MPGKICVFAPAVLLTITIESEGDDEAAAIHVHPGGQGFWVARAIRQLGEDPVICTALGGETGQMLQHLIPTWEIDLEPVPSEANSPAYVHDRRDGTRREIAETPPPTLSRHEIDDLYSKTLETALASGLCVVTGRFAQGGFSEDLYRRLGADLASTGLPVVGDLHGDDLSSFLEGGALGLLKVSTEDLRADGLLRHASQKEIVGAMDSLIERGVRSVVVSGDEGATVARIEGKTLVATQPRLEAVDHRGAGDSMTAGLAVGLAREIGGEAILRLACAAGAAAVVRHGLGSADPELVAELIDLVDIREVTS
ncbi:MAG TPA: PfkB family carbohydrate kinase [Acidimicrobiia bacterium]